MDGHCQKTHTRWHWSKFQEILDCTKELLFQQSLSHSILLLLPQSLQIRIRKHHHNSILIQSCLIYHKCVAL
uniref:GDSL esterase/lipase APG-like n=1 Tax=Rhizophora mucronata TaxID=61149 RepID=A0A2P2JFG6_RHIMU